MPQPSAQQSAQTLLRLARIMLAIQVPVVVVAGVYLFWEFGLSAHSRHHLLFGSILTAAYLVVAVGGIVVMQWSWRSRARRLVSQTEESRTVAG